MSCSCSAGITLDVWLKQRAAAVAGAGALGSAASRLGLGGDGRLGPVEKEIFWQLAEAVRWVLSCERQARLCCVDMHQVRL